MGTNVNMVVSLTDAKLYRRREELEGLLWALIDKRVGTSTVIGDAGVTYGTAKRMVDDAVLIQTELDRVAPLPP